MSNTNITKYIYISEAAMHIGISEASLHEMIQTGKIPVAQLPNGEIAVSEPTVEELMPKEKHLEYQDVEKLRGVLLGINEASKKYEIPFSTLRGWIQRGFVDKVGKKGQKILIDEADVAYCAAVYHQKGASQGRWLFNPDGTPYTPVAQKQVIQGAA
jgi:predicted site-specific integrase-resolvase